MKEQLYTIPLNDAVNANDECPFCNIERTVEHELLDFTLGAGSSYMESDIREETDKAGFCRDHFKKMYDYGNTLGNGWILKTHYMRTIKDMKQQFKSYSPVKMSLGEKLRKKSDVQNSVSAWIKERENSCYICNRFESTYKRYLDTFFVMYKRDAQFRDKVLNSKGFCLQHFGDLCDMAEVCLNEKEKKDFFPAMFTLMENNMDRMFEDVSWLIEMFDHKNQGADWKNSRDANSRGMQKLKGGYPADPIYKMSK